MQGVPSDADEVAQPELDTAPDSWRRRRSSANWECSKKFMVFPAIIICELLGIPAADRHIFRGRTDAIVSTATCTPEQAQDTYLQLAGYLAGLFAQRRRAARR